MTFQNCNIKSSYDTGEGNPLNEFYIPILSDSVKYDRIAGFFSSSSLAIAARGIAGLIRNNGVMRLIASPNLSASDIRVLEEATENPTAYLEMNLLSGLESIEDSFQADHLAALGWMLANGFLHLKLAYVSESEDYMEKSNALFHQKVGILEDYNGNRLSFSGSLNETALGWLENIEEFKVFKEWVPGHKEFFDSDVKKFEDYWNNNRPGVKVIDAPEAVVKKLIKIGEEFDKDAFCLKNYMNKSPNTLPKTISLFPYQEEAKKKWTENNYQLVFEMATGTGKTRTSLACVLELLKKEKSLICIIACPQNTLLKQWVENVEELDLGFEESVIADGTNPRWKSMLADSLNRLYVGGCKSLIIYTTHQTASSDYFIEKLTASAKKIPACFVGDEVHGLGAYKTKKALLPDYRFRIGLSATPKRWFDDYGTELLEDYFGNASFEFTISEALSTINPLTGKTFLAQYRYYPVFVHLTLEEMEDYVSLSKQVTKMSHYAKKSEDYQKRYENLVFKRAKIIKRAQNKCYALCDVLSELQDQRGKITDTLVFTDEELMDEVVSILGVRGIINHRFTHHQGTKPDVKYGGVSEREYLIRLFKEQSYHALVAIKCMDEGIDIPTASTGIIMASSTNPREYIQRIGRVIRQHESKHVAEIYDFIVAPDFNVLSTYPELYEFEQAIFEKEMLRVKAISGDALNSADVLIKLSNY